MVWGEEVEFAWGRYTPEFRNYTPALLRPPPSCITARPYGVYATTSCYLHTGESPVNTGKTICMGLPANGLFNLFHNLPVSNLSNISQKLNYSLKIPQICVWTCTVHVILQFLFGLCLYRSPRVLIGPYGTPS